MTRVAGRDAGASSAAQRDFVLQPASTTSDRPTVALTVPLTAPFKSLGSVATPYLTLRIVAPIAALLVAVLALIVGSSPAFAAQTAELVVDANTGEVLHADDADELRYPASLTKMMTLFMVFEAIERRQLTYDSLITATEAATRRPPSKIGLEVGERITVRQAVAALVTKSANDVAAAVAIHLGGSTDGFARMLTKRARELGMTKTRFRNASGLTDKQQVTTARDMITLALHLQDNYPTHYRNFRIQSFTWRGKTYRNHNSLLTSFYGTNGIKTGYTRASGFNLVSSVQRGKRHVVAAVFGGKTARARDAKMRILLTRGLERASLRKTRTRKPMLVARPSSATPPASRQLAGARSPVLVPAAKQRIAEAPVTSAPRADQLAQRVPQLTMAKTRRVAFQNSAPRTPSLSPGLSLGALIEQTTSAAALDRLARGLPLAAADASAATNVPMPRLALASFGATPSALQSDAPEEAPRRPVETARRPVEAVSAPTVLSAAEPVGPVIQIGAYRTETEAAQRLAAVANANARLLGTRSPVTQPVNVQGRQLYRARFAGFELAEARRACQSLKARGIECLVTQ